MIDTMQIRQLTIDDESLVANMQTGIEDDYVVRVFERLVTHDNQRLYGLFSDGELASIAGYTVYQEQYGMLGRLRSDQRFLGNGYATSIIQYVIRELEQLDEIKWIGANTQLHNYAAKRVLEKLDLPQLEMLYPAILSEPNNMPESTGNTWHALTTLEEKRRWIDPLKQDESVIFPLESYYPFPASPALLTDELLESWTFFENDAQDRFVIIKHDQKKNQYAHVVYLWDDLFEQPGLMKTLYGTLDTFRQQYGDDVNLRFDIPESTRQMIPNDEAFTFQDPWILHGFWKK